MKITVSASTNRSKNSCSIQGGPPEGMSFNEWLDWTYYEGFDPSGLSDEEYYELEDQYNEYLKGCSSIQSSSAVMADVWDEISQVDQEFTSENTSINSNKLPAIFKMIKLPEGSINLDFGGGRFDNVAEYLEPLGVINLVYDPYNRSAEHNQEVVKTLKEAGGADSATCSNVLNVIKEPEARLNVLKNISKMVKPGGDVYITVYEGTGKGNEGATKSGYQLNRKTADYLEEIQQVFPNAERKGKLIVATN